MTEPNQRMQEARRTRAPQPSGPLGWRRWWKLFARTVAFVVALFGFGAAVIAYLPRVTLEMAPPTDASNNFSLLATIQNTGPIPLEDVTLSLGICNIFATGIAGIIGNDYPQCDGPLTSRLTNNLKWRASEMMPDDKLQISWGDLLNIGNAGKLTDVNVSMIVSYRPAYWPFRKEREFGYKTRLKGDGNVEWLYVPRK